MKYNDPRAFIFFSCICWQAEQQLDNRGAYVSPRGFKKVLTISHAQFPFMGFILESTRSIIVAFRGTRDARDLINDFDIIPVSFPFVPRAGLVEKGFLKVYQAFRNQIMDKLKIMDSSKKLFIAGYSLGATLATYLSLDVSFNTNHKEPIVYTFASPKPGSPAFSRIYHNRSLKNFRVFNRFDIIPQFPPIFYQFVGQGVEIHFDTGNLIRNHEMINYVKKLCKNDPQACQAIARREPRGFLPLSTKQKLRKK